MHKNHLKNPYLRANSDIRNIPATSHCAIQSVMLKSRENICGVSLNIGSIDTVGRITGVLNPYIENEYNITGMMMKVFSSVF